MIERRRPARHGRPRYAHARAGQAHHERSRRALLGIAALAALALGAVGGHGVLAVFTDTATTGASGDTLDMESLETAAIPVTATADLQIARYPFDPTCGTFRDDLQLPVNQVEGVLPGDTELGGPLFGGICATNVGSEPLTVTVAATDITSAEVTCEPDEAPVDPNPADCGDPGEAAPYVRYRVTEAGRDSSNGSTCPFNPVPSGPYVALAATTGATFDLDPGEVACFAIDLAYDPPAGDPAVAAQTDVVRWRFQLVGETAGP